MLIQAFVNECDDEISGLSEVGVSPRGFVLKQPFILKQTVTTGSTDLTEAAAEFVFKLVSENQSPAPFKFWWHSHVNMNVFWSEHADEITARGFQNEFMISMVMNRRGEFLTRLDVFEPFPLTIYDLPVVVELTPDEKMVDFVREEIDGKVKSPFDLGGIMRLGRKFLNIGGEKIVVPQPVTVTTQKPASETAAGSETDGTTVEDGKDNAVAGPKPKPDLPIEES